MTAKPTIRGGHQTRDNCGKEDTTVEVIKTRFLKAGVSEEIVDFVYKIINFIIINRISMVMDSTEQVTPIQFAVIAFILQKQQQGVVLPRRLPLPLRSLLPARQVDVSRNIWELSEKKLNELQELWSSSCNKKNQITLRTAKSIISSICKNPSVCRQM